ncbi:MAG: ATP-dependent metallopeptidase FtsH/Yme1/Tma family protein [Ruminococcaceae bacterium]|nr:ATP-dependent metallopeptidase FtsH/Yme1/Tma family protein [Oscillospiraceae bacterium]
MKKNLKNVLLYLGIPIIFIIAVVSVSLITKNTAEMKYSEIVEMVKNNEVSEYTLNLYSGQLTYTKRADDKVYRYTVADPSLFIHDVEDAVMQIKKEYAGTSKDITFDYDRGGEGAWIVNLLPTVLMVVLLAAFWIFFMKKMNSSMGADKTLGFGKSKARRDTGKKKTTFADVAGADEEKEEMAEIVDFLKDPKKFNDLGARIPKGVLLVGPPGTGKTLLARAVAGEAGVPFFSISGSDFVEMFVGVGASRVRDLFGEAKKEAPAIIFIDEIDAVGRQRGAGLGGGHDEREQTLNQLLVEMDGFGVNEGVIVMAATNRPDILDKALLRPGRFDRQITVGYPDVKGREEILKVHSRGKPLGPDVNLATIAKSTSGFTGADLENLLNESALLAVRHGKKAITQEEIEEATIKVVMGAEKKSHIVKERDKMITSYHEAGHAIVSYFLPTQDPVHQISIIKRGMAAGYTMYLPTDEKGHVSKKQMLEQICSLLGGRAAEQLTQDDVCTGASNDIDRATDLARRMVTKFGMSDRLGLVTYGNDNNEVFLGRDFSSTPNYSEKTAAVIDEEIENVVMNQYAKALELLNNAMPKLHEVAKILFEREKISGDEFRSIMEAE